MTDHEPSSEREPTEQLAAKYYYFDLQVIDRSYQSMIMAIDRLLDAMPLAVPLTVDEVCENVLVPSAIELDENEREALEKLAIFPLGYLGPKLEQSGLSPQDGQSRLSTVELQRWYEAGIRGLRRNNDEFHDNVCIDETDLTHMKCFISDTCPYRFAQRFLADDVMQPDFSALAYLDDPERARTIALNKFHLAVKYKYVGASDAQRFEAGYIAKYEEIFAPASQQ
jgi:hypothetical protein